jgi:hypothetical protein
MKIKNVENANGLQCNGENVEIECIKFFQEENKMSDVKLTDESDNLLTLIKEKREYYRKKGLGGKVISEAEIIERALKVYSVNIGLWD